MSDEDKYLFFPKYVHAGLSNQLIELEIKVGLAYLSGRTLVTRGRLRLKTEEDFDQQPNPRSAKLLDLFEIPVKQVTAAQLNGKQFPSYLQLPWGGDCSSKAFFCYPDIDAFPSAVVASFRNNRQYCWQFPSDNNAELWISPQRTLSHYSYFFLAPDETLRQVRETIRKIRPKNHYSLLADRIAGQLEPFNAVHIRRGDFRQWWVECPGAEKIVVNMEKVIPRDELLIICTDSSNETEFFRPILARYPKSLFIDQLIKSDHRQGLNQLPFNDSGVISLLTQLIAARSRVFVGTFFSTFSSRIHRLRCLEDPDRKMLYVSNPFDPAETPMVDCEFVPVRNSEFSWNQYNYPLPPNFFSWFREWPEAIQPPLKGQI